MTERERQERLAWAQPFVYRHHYLCSDGFTFSARAPSESGAFRVLNAERPGVLVLRYDGVTAVPAPPLERRLAALAAEGVQS